MDLRKNRLPLAVVLLVLLGGGTFLALRNRNSESEGSSSREGSAELPTIERDAITAFEITRPGSPPIRLERSGEEWRLEAPTDSAVELSTVNAALDKLSSLEVTGIAATRAANHGTLEVDSEHGIHVVVFGGEAKLADLWVGALRSANTMVRVEGEDAVLSVRGSLRYAFDKEVKEWRDRRILEEDAAHVRAVAFEFGEQHLRFERGADEGWVQSKGQPAIERFSGAKLESIVSALAGLRAIDFAAPDLDAAATGLATPAATVTLTMSKPEASPPAGSAEDEAPAEGADEGAPASKPPAGEAAQAEAAGGDAPRTIVLRLGSAADGAGNAYVQIDGEGLIYTVSGFVAERMHPEVSLLQEPEPGAEPEAAAMPEGAGGEQQIPPELLQQLQQQLGGAH